VHLCIAHERGRDLMGDLPPGVEVTVVEGPRTSLRDVEFWVPPFLAPPAADVLEDAEQLRVVQLLSAGVDSWLGKLPSHATLCDARGVHTTSTSEWAVAAILSFLRDFPRFARAQARGEWQRGAPTDELAGKRVLIVGAGDIGEAIAARLTPFQVSIQLVARSARPGIRGVSELPKLLPESDIVVLVVPLTSQTTGLVDAAFLAAMPDGSLLVNAARGPIVDSPALTQELVSGRLNAAVDVTDPEPLPPDSPLWGLPNLLLTPHVGGSVRGLLRRCYGLVGDQVRRYVAGQPLINVVHGEY
jgi:phosphoglycerate dehydrogenase-like enzyme